LPGIPALYLNRIIVAGSRGLYNVSGVVEDEVRLCPADCLAALLHFPGLHCALGNI